MIHSKALLSVLAISVGLSFGIVDLGWSQDQTQDRDRLHTPDQLQDQEKEMLREKEQLREQRKEKEMKQERLEKGIHSQDRSKTPNLPQGGNGGRSGGMGGGRGR